MPFDRRFLTWVIGAASSLLLAVGVEAQFTGCPSYIAITEAPPSPYYQSAADFTVEYGDLVTGSPPCLSFGNTYDTLTFRFYVNTVDRKSFFAKGFTSAIGTDVPLEHEETNVLIAEITGWDENNIPRTDRDTIVIEVDTTPPPVVSVAFNTLDNQNATLCANACFAATYAQSTVPYFTLDQPRSVTLAYHGDRLAPHPFIYADVDVPFGSRVPVRFWMEVKHDGAALPFTNGDTRLYFAGDSQPVRLAGQLKMNDYATGIYPIQIVVTTEYTDASTEEVSTNVPLMVVNERVSPVARGWSLAGVQRLVSSGDTLVMITEGDGSALLFKRTCGDPCVFTTPEGDYSKLTASGAGSGRTYVRAYTDSSRAIFDHLGRLTKVIRYPADTTEFAYDGASRLTKVYDPFRRYNGGANKSYIALTYGTYGLQSIQEPGPDGGTTGGRITYVTVTDSALRVIKDPDGDSTRFTYDDSLRLSTVTDRRSSTTTYGYDNRSWKLTSVTLPQIPIDAGGGTTTNASPVTTFSPWQVVGVPTLQTSTQSPATGLSKADTVTASVTDAEGRVTRYTVNKWGLPLKTTDPLGRVTTAYRGAGFGVFADSVVFYTGAVDRFQYSGQFLVYEHREGKNPINYRYAGWGLIDKIWGTNYVTKEMSISSGRVQWVRLAEMDSLKTQYDYDNRGRLTGVIQPRGQVTVYHYDATFGNQDSTLAPAGRFSRTRFDSQGRDSLTQANGFPWQLVTYDVMNRVASVYDSVGIAAPTTYSYDERFLTDVRDPLGQRYRFEHNALGWLTKTYDPADTTTWSRYVSYRFNKVGLETSRTNRRNQRIDQTYDVLNRLRSRSIGGTPRDSFAYDSLDRYTVAWNAVARDSTFIAKSGWVDSVVTRFAGTTNRFRVYQKPTAVLERDSTHVLADSAITFVARKYIWHAQTRALQQIKIDGEATELSRNRDLDVVETNWPGLSNTRTDLLTVQQRPYDQSYTSSNSTLWRGFGYDSLGRVANYLTKNTVTGGHDLIRFGYDRLGRLSEAEYGGLGTISHCAAPDSILGYACTLPTFLDSTITYTYDLVGNRTDATDEIYAVGNRLVRFNGDTFTVDLDGNITRKANTYYHWSADGLLDSVVAGTTTLRYEYDASGRLVRTSRNGVVQRHLLWDGAQLLAELNATAKERIGEYVYLPGIDRPMMIVTGATSVTAKNHLVLDQLGNVVGAVNGGSYTMRYDPWGKQTQASGSLATVNRLTWKGLLWEGDSTRLYYARNRWYDPEVGRFVSEDPIGLGGGLNAYVLNSGDPINNADPFGLAECQVGSNDWLNSTGSCAEGCKIDYDEGGSITVDWACEDVPQEECRRGVEACQKAFAGIFGVWIGAFPTDVSSAVNHTVISTVSTEGAIRYTELWGLWDCWTNCFNNRWGNKPLNGNPDKGAWAPIGDPLSIPAVDAAIIGAIAEYQGFAYTLGSNRFTSSVIRRSRLRLSVRAYKAIGRAPGICVRNWVCPPGY